MKTRKVGLNQIILVTFLAVILITGSVRAEGTEVHVVSGLENISEPRLEVEKWMISETFWYHSQNSFAEEYEEEENLCLEDWMVDKSIWQVPVIEYFQDAKDQKLVVENWMTDKKYWN